MPVEPAPVEPVPTEPVRATAVPGDAGRPVVRPGECDPTVRHVGVRVEGSASGVSVDDVEIDDAEVTALELDGGRITRLVLTDAQVRAVSLVEVDLSDGRWSGVDASECRWVSCVVDGGTWELVTAVDVRAVRLSARQVTWRQVTWRDCDLTGLDLTGARLERVRFERCAMTDADFSAATVKSAEFVDCDLAGVRNVGSLRGATVDVSTLTSMAATMAVGFGLKIDHPR